MHTICKENKMVSFIHLIPLLLLSVAGAAAYIRPVPATFNVVRYGAVPNRITDNTKAFDLAWKDACSHRGGGRLLVPRGTFMLGAILFVGPCMGPIDFVLRGSLEASNNPKNFFIDHWITFKYIDQLTIGGGGSLFGHGGSAWHYNDCAHNPRCKTLPVTMRFDFVTNSRISHIRSVNSKNAHFNIFACRNLNMTNIRISAPGDSPNTDGIHIGSSTQIRIEDSVIMTGDDCVSILSGSHDITISGVHCGPGHGFSIGSLGGSHNKEYVTGIVIRNSTLHGTQNGLRIKTWAPSNPSLASDILFDDIIMVNVNNPIFIDQQYCPSGNCDKQAQSRVQIRNVTFRKVRGTSSSMIAVKIQCSKTVPCEGIKLVDINLAYRGPGGRVASSCWNVEGESYGPQIPSGCL